VRVVKSPGIFWAGVWRPLGAILSDIPENVSRQMIESGQAVNLADWPTQGPTLMPWSLQNVTPGSGGGGAGVGSINGLDGDIQITAGPNIVVTTTAPSTIIIGAPNVVPTSRQIIAGPGLSGGGALTGNITLTADVTSVFGRTGAITAQASDYHAGQIGLQPPVGSWTTVQQAITALAASTGASLWQEATSPAGAIYYTGGNVGVKQPNPQFSVDVVGSINVTGGFFLNGVLFAGTGVPLMGGVGSAAYVAAAAPSSPVEGQFWFNSDHRKLYIRYADEWVGI